MKKETTWAKVRKFLTDVHLWLGLGSGLIVFIVCLTGTIYVFNTEIREAATPELFKISKPGTATKTPEELIAIVEKSGKGKVVGMRIPADASRSWQFSVKKEEGKDEKKERGDKAERAVAAVSIADHKVPESKKEARIEKSNNRAEGKQSENGAKERKGGKAEKGGKPEKGGRGGRPTTYYVNPYTAEILGNSGSVKSSTVDFMGYMFSLHRWLLLDKIEEPIFESIENRKLGSYITGIATILFTVGVITGMAIWFPRKIRSWKEGLKIKWSANWKRKNHDLHNTLGFYSCIFLFLMGITGPIFSFEWYREGLRKALGTYQPADMPQAKPLVSDLTSISTEKLKVMQYSQAVTAVLGFPGDQQFSFPSDSAGTVSVTKYKKGFFAPAAGDKVVLDQYTGKVLELAKFSDLAFNERVSGSLKALHLGDVYGTFSKIIYFFACLIATSLPITGTMIWLNKMKKKKKKPSVKTALPSMA